MSSGSKAQTIGYRYGMGLLMGLCRGPIDALKEITVGGKLAWPRNYITGGTPECSHVTTSSPEGNFQDYICLIKGIVNHDAPPSLTTDGVSYIAAGDLFGGDEKEGGIEGHFELMMGSQNQQKSESVSRLLGTTDHSALRGVVCIYFNGLIASMNPYPKPWAFRVVRREKGWAGPVFYPEKLKIDMWGNRPDLGANLNKIEAMNPAHIVYECATNPDWGRGLPPSLIDEASFRYAADLLAAEGFGLCLPWVRQDQIGAFISQVMDHIGGLMYVSRITGLLVLRLVRNDYEVDDLPIYSLGYEGGIVSFVEDDDGSVAALTNEIIVKYTDGVTGDEGMVRYQNIASMEISKAVNSKTVEYPGVPTAALANRLAQRDLRVHGTPLRRLTLAVNRRGNRLAPGDAIRVIDTSRRLTGQIFRVFKLVDVGGGLINITAVQDIFGLAAAPVMGEVPPNAQPSAEPLPAPNVKAFEASYIDVYRALDVSELPVDPDVTFLGVAAQRPNDIAANFTVYSGSNNSGFTSKSRGDWAATGTLASAISKKTNKVVLQNTSLMDRVVAGQGGMIDDEFIRVDGYDAATQELSFSRGCVDTVPAEHAAGARVWFHYVGVGADPTVYSQGQSVSVKVLTNTNAGQLYPALATSYPVTFVNRQDRPYPPGNVRVENIPYVQLGPVPSNFTITWVGRNRLTQQDVLVATHEPNVTAEAGTTYTVVVRNRTSNGVIRTVSGITQNFWQYTDLLWQGDGSPYELRIELYARRGSIDSYQGHAIDITVIPQIGFGRRFGRFFSSGIRSTYPAGGVVFLLHGDGANNSTAFPEFLRHSYLASAGVQTRTDLSPFGSAWIDLPTNTDIRYIGKVANNVGEWELSGVGTVEARILLSADSAECTIAELIGYNDAAGWRFWVGSDSSLNYGRRYVSGATQRLTSAAGAVPRGAARHVAMSRDSSGVCRLFVGGVQVASGQVIYSPSTSGNATSTTLAVGGPIGVGSMRVEEVRINTTTAYYTAAFTPPSGPHADPV